ncbi:MAG: ABC transporter substrate-binding protein, partial [Brachybacterium sp.]|nr:ABC transporter substrate-binding protein [Brachybacterium sp.]
MTPLPRPTRRAATAGGLLLPLGALAACADPSSTPAAGGSGDEAAGAADGETTAETTIDTSGSQEPLRAEADEELASRVPPELAERGTLVVGGTATTPPLTFLADDNSTTLGSEVDIARLVADTLGLDFEHQLTSWDTWPLKLEAGDYDAVFSNVGVNDERLERYDFASYRAAFMTFLVTTDSGLELGDPASISGRIIAVSAATNQERILTDWNDQLTADGQEPAELRHYSNDADVLLALGAGRVDAYFAPYATLTYTASVRDDVLTQGTVNAGWPDETLVAGTFVRGSGLADLASQAIERLIADGTYAQVLERWGL